MPRKTLSFIWMAFLACVLPNYATAACQPYWTAQYKCRMGCGPCAGSSGNTGNGGNSNYDYGAAQRAQEAAAAAAAEADEQRQRDAELEQQRLEAENKRRMEEIAKQAKFIEDRDASAGTLRGSSGSSTSNGESGLRGSSTTYELRGSSPDTVKAPNTDPMVVDGRNVPSGLPESVDTAILSGYSNAPPGVSDRVRKGFQAVMTHDWKAARAWFEDALNHDPNNAGLKRLVILSDYTEKHKHLSIDGKPPQQALPRRGRVQLPTDSDMEFLFPGWQPAPTNPSPTKENKLVQLPKDSDIEFLFPGLPAVEAKQLNDYMMDQAIKMTENDPVLIKLSARHTKGKKPTYPHN